MAACCAAGFVLVGRALEERAKLRASADMVALQELVPQRARLALRGGGYKEVGAAAASHHRCCCTPDLI